MFNSLFDTNSQYYVTLKNARLIVEKILPHFYYEKVFDTNGTFALYQKNLISFDAEKFIENILEENENSTRSVIEINDIEEQNKMPTEGFITIVKEIITQIPNIFVLRCESKHFNNIVKNINVHLYYICDDSNLSLEDVYEQISLPTKVHHVHCDIFNCETKYNRDLYNLPKYTRANIITLALTPTSGEEREKHRDLINYVFKNGWQIRNYENDLIYFNTPG